MKDISENVSNHEIILDAIKKKNVSGALEIHRAHFKNVRFLFDLSMRARFSDSNLAKA
jgi:DNA-binding GntR family transcriptional regulator